MDQKTITLTIIGMACVTYLPRLLPLWALGRKRDSSETATSEAPSQASHPTGVARLGNSWLRYVPTAVLSAMLLPTILITDGQLSLGTSNLFLWAALPTLFVAWKTRSLFGAVAVGIATVAAARYVFIA